MRPTTVFMAALALFSTSAAHAQLSPLHRVDLSSGARVKASRAATDTANAIMRGDYRGALALANEGLAADPHDAWLHYDKGIALFDLNRIEEAVAEEDLALRDFPAEDTWGRSVATYQKAIKLQQAQRCREANAAFVEYSNLVRAADPESARLALHYAATGCVLPVAAAPLAPAVPSSERQPVRGRIPSSPAAPPANPPASGSPAPAPTMDPACHPLPAAPPSE